jgi:hypothetical protein
MSANDRANDRVNDSGSESIPDGGPNHITTEQREQQLRRLEEVVGNAMMMRAELFQRFMDPRRNVMDECGYPKTSQMTAEGYHDLYDRNPIAARVVELYPKESWQVTPLVYEDEDSETNTEFEDAWDNLGKSIRGGEDVSWFKDEEGSPVWEYLRRVDELSGIGTFGILLIGIDDGLPLEAPAEGVQPDGSPFMPPPGNIPNGGMGGMGGMGGVSGVGPPGSAARRNGGGNGAGGFYSDMGGPGGLYGAIGTDAMYFEPQYGAGGGTWDSAKRDNGARGTKSGSGGVGSPNGDDNGDGPPVKRSERKLLFLRAFGENLVQVVRYETSIYSPRFGQPTMYQITFNDPRSPHAGIGLPLATVMVHWSRVVHVADVTTPTASEVFAVPRMQQVLNRLLDLDKLYGGSAEMYWQGAFPGLSFETHPALGGDVEVSTSDLREMMESYRNGLQRYLSLIGMSAKSLAPQVVDPSSQIEVQIEAICIKLGCPVRVFKGSERGELASSQDDASWNDRLGNRQNTYVTPRIIVPFVDRLIALGILPEPGEENGYHVQWPDLDSLTDKDKSAIALQETQALVAYVSGNVEQVVPPHDFLTRVLGWDDEEAEATLAAAETDMKKQEQEDARLAQQHGMIPTPPPGFQHPEPPPVVVAPGGKPMPGAGNGVGAKFGAVKGAPVAATGGPKPPTTDGNPRPTRTSKPFTRNEGVSNIDQYVEMVGIEYGLTPAEMEMIRNECNGWGVLEETSGESEPSPLN